MIGTIGVNTIDGAIQELVQKVAGKELDWDSELIANVREEIEEELKRKGVYVQYPAGSLGWVGKPMCYPVDCDECETRKECSSESYEERLPVWPKLR